MVFVKYAILKHLSQISLAARLVKDIWRKTRSTDSIGKTQSKMNAHIGFPLKMAETTLGARRWATLFAQPGRHQSPKMHNVLSPLMGVHSLFVCRVCLRALSHQCVNVFHARLAPWNVFVLSSLCQPSSSPDDCQDPVARTWLNLCLSNLCVSCLLVCFVTPIFLGITNIQIVLVGYHFCAIISAVAWASKPNTKVTCLLLYCRPSTPKTFLKMKVRVLSKEHKTSRTLSKKGLKKSLKKMERKVDPHSSFLNAFALNCFGCYQYLWLARQCFKGFLSELKSHTGAPTIWNISFSLSLST